MTIALLILGFIAFGIVAALLVVLLFGNAAYRLAGQPALRRGLLARGVDARLIDKMSLEWTSARPGFAVFLIVVSLVALIAATAMHMRLDLTPGTVLFVVPSVSCLVWAGFLLRNVRARPDDSPLHHTLVTRANDVVELAPTIVMLNINITGALDALAQTRVTQRRPIPHVIVRSNISSSRPCTSRRGHLRS